jgi:hypothetical protein
VFSSGWPPNDRRGRRPDADVRLLERAAADILAAQRDAARQLDEVDEVAPAYWQRLDFAGADHPAEIDLAHLDRRCLDLNGHLLRHVPYCQFEVGVGGAANRDHQRAPHRGSKSGQDGAQLVLSWLDVGDPVAPLLVGHDSTEGAGRHVPAGHGHAGDDRAAAVANDA